MKERRAAHPAVGDRARGAGQPRRPIGDGTLGSEDEQVFRFRAERGQTLTIAMNQAEGSSLDPLLDVFAGVEFPSIEDAGDFYSIAAGANFRL